MQENMSKLSFRKSQKCPSDQKRLKTLCQVKIPRQDMVFIDNELLRVSPRDDYLSTVTKFYTDTSDE